MKVDKPVQGPKTIQKRQFSHNAIKEFIHFLQKESWHNVLMLEDVNKSFNALKITFMYHFNALFPTKTFYLNKNKNNKWMTKGLIVSRNKLRFLNGLKRSTQISGEFRGYINKYQLIYKNLIKEAKKNGKR
jgi:hypothetical protein